MKDIQQLIKKNSQEGRYESIFPKTFIDAVEDRESGNNLNEILSGFNMYFLSYNGSRELTRLRVPLSLRKTGLWITYVLYDKTVVTEWYAGEAIDDDSWKNLSNWRVGSNMLVGDISISSDGYWVVNGVITTTKAQGEQGEQGIQGEQGPNGLTPVVKAIASVSNNAVGTPTATVTEEGTELDKIFNFVFSNLKGETGNPGIQGITPMLRVGSNNHLQASYTNGSSWVDVSTNPVYTQFRINNNKLEQSVDLGDTWIVVSDELAYQFRNSGNKLQVSKDLGVTWEDISDYIAAWFKFTGTTGSSQADNVGKIQISRDNGATWSDLSEEFTNSLHIKGYVATVPNLPSTAVQGDIYGVGPTYDSSDTEQTNPIYQLYVKDNTGWVNNGRFTSISAGIVQELGDSETSVMSQKAVTDKLSELGSEVKYFGVTLDNQVNKMISELYLTGLDKSKEYEVYQIYNGNESRSIGIYESNRNINIATAWTSNFSKDIIEVKEIENSGVGGWIVVNWDVVPKETTNCFVKIRQDVVSNLSSHPRIASEIHNELTDEKLDKLDAKDEILRKEIIARDTESIIFSEEAIIPQYTSGYGIDGKGKLFEEETYGYYAPILLKKDESIVLKGGKDIWLGSNVSVIYQCDSNGVFIKPLVLGNGSIGKVIFTYGLEDIYVGISCVIADLTYQITKVRTLKEFVHTLEKSLEEKANKSDISTTGFALSIGADSVRSEIPIAPWFDEVEGDGTTYGTYLDDKIDSVPQGDSFIFISDVHYVGNKKHSAKLIDYVRRRLGIKTIIHGGNVLDESPTITGAAKEWLNFNRDFVLRMGGDFKQVCGDHDHNGRYASEGQALSYQFIQRVMNGYNIKELTYDTLYDEQVKEVSSANSWTENEKKEYDAWKKMHYYFDDSTIKTRFVVLHTGWNGDVGLAVDKLGSNVLSADNALYLQMDFLYESLITCPNGYNVIVVGHNVIGNKSYTVDVSGGIVPRYNVNELVWKGAWRDVARMLKTFKSKSTTTLSYRDWGGEGLKSKLFNFATAKTPNIVLCMGGDVHWDILGKFNDSENLEPVTIASSLENVVPTEGTISKSDILQALTMTDGADRGYKVIIAPPSESYDDEKDSVLASRPNTNGTLDAQAFDIVTVTNNTIYFTRIGSGEDRVVYISE